VRRWVPHILVLLVLGALYFTGVIANIDDAVRDARFRLAPRDATGDVVLVQIDAKSLREAGVWPWPRRMYARLLDRLIEAGVKEIAFDIDFSAASNSADDNAFEMALAKAAKGALVILPNFHQYLSAGSEARKIVVTKPLARFARHAWPASVNVSPGADGIVRTMRSGAVPEDGLGYSLIDVLSGRTMADNNRFLIDFAIRPASIPRLSFGAVMRGEFEPGAVRGRKIIVGATAAELGDRFSVPVRGVIPGSLLQAIGLESILQNRQLHQTGILVTAIGLIFIFAAISLTRERLSWRRVFVLSFAAMITIEAAALLIQRVWPVSMATVAWHTVIALHILGALLREIDLQTLLALIAVTEKENQEQLMRHVVTDSFDGIVVIDAEARIVSANSAAHAILQVDHGTLRSGTHIESALPVLLARAGMDTVSGGQNGCSDCLFGEISFPAMNDELVDIEYVITQSTLKRHATKSNEASVIRNIATLTFRDITQRKKAEHAILKAAQDSENANRAKTQFMANMGHELRTPLNSILGFSEIIKDQLIGPVGSDKYVDYAGEINTSGNQLLSMLNNILDISKVEANSLQIDEDAVDMTDVIATVRHELTRWDGLQHRTIDFHVEEGLPAVRADYRLLRKTLINLLSNAVKFTAADGQIAVSVSVNAETGLIISVHDDGIGIPQEHIAEVTKPFYQADAALDRLHDGSGLGLALVKAYARAHDGTIEIQSTPGTETTVIIRLPRERMIIAGNDMCDAVLPAGALRYA